MSFESLARECGIDFGDYGNSYDDSGVAFPAPSAHSEYDEYPNDVDELLDQIENSSPSPPERRNVIRSQTFYNFSQQPPHQDHPDNVQYDEITQFQDQPYYEHQDQSFHNYPQSQRQPFPAAITGPSGVRISDLNRHESTTNHFAFRESSRTAPIQHTRYQPRPSMPGQVFLDDPQLYKEDVHTRGSNPRNAHGIRLRPVSELPDVYRGMFKFGVFNAVQSHCFDSVMHTDESMVISAPTGSGKTVLFELAIVRMLMRVGGNSGTSKCIYVAPTKALCSEKCRDWTTKFQALGIKCCELTGDTVVFGKGAWGNAKDADVIITTGEKWDSLTRHWRDYGQILSQIQLFLVDEVHILNESRGSTLEVIISRMKTRGSSVRFIVVSATVPNIEDVASWIGNGLPGGSAAIKQFGEEFRPCKLTKIVHAYSKKKDLNDFAFQRMLDMKLYSILEQHSVDKPMLVFGTTRKGVVITAEQMLKCYEEAMKKRAKLPWTKPSSVDRTFHDKKLEKLASFGIGVHHAGMNMDDRRLTEDLYVKKILRILFATSTLAVGVNLPAHTVIIKGVKLFQNNSMQEYSDLDIMQMMGRAGRPQFDKEGVAIIMCETELEGKYKALVQGQMLLESCLHHNLSEHINSEIGLGTITDLDSAKKWLHNSFLFQRIQKNPRHYAIGKDGAQTWQERIGEMVTQSITDLQDNNLVSRPEDGDHQLSSTEFGDIMSKFYIRQSTMSMILKLSDRATMKEILETISNAEEFSDIKLRGGEKQIYNKMREHNDIRFQIKKVEKPADKVFMLIQAVLGGLSLSDNEYKNGDNNPTLEAVSVFRHIARIAKAVVEVAIIRRAGAELKNSLETLRCLTAKAWEDRPVVLRQIEQIGEKSLKVLAEYNIGSFDVLRKQDPMRLEALLNRRPPFGHEILAHVNSLPQYTLSITELSVTRGGGSKPVEVELSIDVGLVEEGISLKSKKSKGKSADSTVVLTLTSDNDFIDFRRVPTKLLKNSKTFTVSAELVKPSQSIIVQMASTNIAGVSLSKAYRPTLEAKYYPTMNTRPQNAVDLMLEGLEDDPDFWNMGPNDEDIPMKDLTQHRKSEDAVQRGNTRKTPLRPEKAESRGAAVPSTVQLGFKRLSNGNFECNHACKDKTKCRHMCCRDGVEKPPPMSKKRIEALCASEESTVQSCEHPKTGSVHEVEDEDVVKPKAKQKPKVRPCDKPDARLQQLDSLHEQTNVKENLKLPEGRRIKLDSQCSTDIRDKGKRRAKPNFDLEFSCLHDEAAARLDITELTDDSDDDLPDARDILDGYSTHLKRQKQPPSDPSETNYSNSEVDALIRAVPVSAPDAPIELEDLYTTSVHHDPGVSNAFQLPSSSRKRKHQTDTIPSQSKRSRMLDGRKMTSFHTTLPVSTSKDLPDLREGKENQTENQGPLFTELSSDNEGDHIDQTGKSTPPDWPIAFSHHSFTDQDDFVLNPGLINITPASPTPAMSTSTPNIDNTTSFGSQLPLTASTSQLPQSRESGQNESHTQERANWSDEDEEIERANAAYQKELDDLDEWFQSGAIKIVDTMP